MLHNIILRLLFYMAIKLENIQGLHIFICKHKKAIKKFEKYTTPVYC